LSLTDATITLPDGRPLLAQHTLTLSRGESVVIGGRSGSGKSTLFRAIAGIWPFGSGTLTPPAGRRLFLPQRPYIPLGTLRHAIAYPEAADQFDDKTIIAALTASGLGGFAGRLDEDANWAQTLSGGEQQRLAIARALLIKPDWLFLDEATASLDPESESALYLLLKRELPATTIVSIAHRASVAAFHHRHLRIERPGEAPGHIVEAVNVE
jgi:putative ATP-binding cassette transporter